MFQGSKFQKLAMGVLDPLIVQGINPGRFEEVSAALLLQLVIETKSANGQGEAMDKLRADVAKEFAAADAAAAKAQQAARERKAAMIASRPAPKLAKQA